MGTKYTTQSASGYNSSPPADDGTQVASNLVTWAGVKTKLADPIKTLADAENTALVAAFDLSARAISSPDTAIASDHWKTLQVTGNTTITLSSAASMGAGYEVGVFNAGTGVVTVTPGAAADTINGVSASVTVSIKGTKIFRTNQALTGYNVVGGYDPQTVTATTNVITPIIDTGTTGSGALKTNNGTTVLTWKNDTSVDIAGGLNPGFTSAETAIAVAGTATNIAHGLGVVPRTYMVTMRNKTAELGYSVGDEAPLWAGASMICADATNITINWQTLQIFRKDNATQAVFTAANWKYVAKAMK